MSCGMYKVLVNGKLAENATLNLFSLFWHYNKKKPRSNSKAVIMSSC